jgi:hypothetical protein
MKRVFKNLGLRIEAVIDAHFTKARRSGHPPDFQAMNLLVSYSLLARALADCIARQESATSGGLEALRELAVMWQGFKHRDEVEAFYRTLTEPLSRGPELNASRSDLLS